LVARKTRCGRGNPGRQGDAGNGELAPGWLVPEDFDFQLVDLLRAFRALQDHRLV
jgi:hypothetical protein